MRWTYENFADNLQGVTDKRLYEFHLPGELSIRIANLWPEHFLGPVLPPGAKLDGRHPSAFKGQKITGNEWDAAWLFEEFGLILFHLAGLVSGDGDYRRPLIFVLAGKESDVSGFSKYVDRTARRYTRRNRVITTIGESTMGSSKVRLDPQDVFLPSGVREDLLRDARSFMSGKRWYNAHGIPWRRAIMLFGPPGTGKTMVARMIASQFFDRRKGVYMLTFGPRTDFGDVRHAFSMSSVNPPSLLILEDLESVQTSNVGRSPFLNLIDGVSTQVREGVYILASTNHPEALDTALVGRPGRWDRSIEIGLPSADARRHFMERKWAGTPYSGLIATAVAESDGLNMASLNEIHYRVAMIERDGGVPTERDVRAILRELKQVEKMKESGRWEPSRERTVGFAPVASSWGDSADATARGDD